MPAGQEQCWDKTGTYTWDFFTDGFWVTVQTLCNAVGRTKGSLDAILSSWMFLSAFLLLPLNGFCISLTVFLCDCAEYLNTGILTPVGVSQPHGYKIQHIFLRSKLHISILLYNASVSSISLESCAEV